SAGGRPSRRGRRGRCGWWSSGRLLGGRGAGALPGGGRLVGGRLPGGRGPAAAVRRALLDGGEHALDLLRLLEGGGGVGALADRGDEVRDLMGEGVLVPEPVPGGPPVGGIGVLGLGGEDAGEALAAVGGGRVVELQLVHPLEVEGERAGGAVDL